MAALNTSGAHRLWYKTNSTRSRNLSSIGMPSFVIANVNFNLEGSLKQGQKVAAPDEWHGEWTQPVLGPAPVILIDDDESKPTGGEDDSKEVKVVICRSLRRRALVVMTLGRRLAARAPLLWSQDGLRAESRQLWRCRCGRAAPSWCSCSPRRYTHSKRRLSPLSV